MSIPLRIFQNHSQLLQFIGDIELSQEGNKNAYTRLFVNNNRVVSKLFICNPVASKKNISNISMIYDIVQLHQLDSLVMPIELLQFNGVIIGYTMLYYKGQNLDAFLNDTSIAFNCKINIFSKILDLIINLPDGVYIGDLHGENILITPKGELKLIDIDGFSLESGHKLTCPLAYKYHNKIPSKYLNKNGKFDINKQSDIECLFNLLFNLLLNNINFESFSLKWKEKWYEYLREKGITPDFINASKQLSLNSPISINPRIFDNLKNLQSEISYQDFLLQSELISEEKIAYDYILNFNRMKEMRT